MLSNLFRFSLCLFFISVQISTGFASLPKNVILFIGDGMGPSLITATRIYAQGSQSQLFMETFPITGFSKTYSSDNLVTDSAAGATALSSGVKVYNNSINMSDPKYDLSGKSQKLDTIVDLFKSKQMSIGIITTTEVTHATPAAFYAHAEHRKQAELIAAQIVKAKADLIMGGGAKYFPPSLTEELKNNNWNIIKHRNELKQTNSLPILGLFNQGHLSYMLDRKQNQRDQIEPTLSEMTAYAIELLSKNPKGFFLMVEGGRIDHAAHENKAEHIFNELIEFDQSIKVASEKLSSETLMIITADHDTAGLAISGYAPLETQGKAILLNTENNPYGKYPHLNFATGPGKSRKKIPSKIDSNFQHPANYKLSMAAHTAVDVPVMAKGNCSENFSGFQKNTDIAFKILNCFGLKFEQKSPNLTTKAP